MALKFITADEAARLIKNGDTVGFGGFTSTGSPKEVPEALARRAEGEHEKGNPFKIDIIAGASLSDSVDGHLSRANAIRTRVPYMANKDLRDSINRGEVRYYDLHLSLLAQEIRCGFYGDVDVMIVEACDVTDEGEIVLTCGVGIAPTLCTAAKKIIVELNTWHPKELRGLHDLAELDAPPAKKMLEIYDVKDRVGSDCLRVDPEKIVVVKVHRPNNEVVFSCVDEITTKIGQNVTQFFVKEMNEGRVPKTFLPLQVGVGNIANATVVAMGKEPRIPNFSFYTEIIQETVIDLIKEGRVDFASGCGLSVCNETTKQIYENLDFFKERLVLRSPEFTNNPSIVRSLGVITLNTAIEADLFGNINSSHMCGGQLMNGIGGSADFSRSGYVSVFVTPSTAKGGKVSCVVPMVTHHDHTEHSIKVVVSEYGVADLRGKSPVERAEEMIEHCAHPDYRPLLRKYLSTCKTGHIPMNLKNVFAFHNAFIETGDMRNAEFV